MENLIPDQWRKCANTFNFLSMPKEFEKRKKKSWNNCCFSWRRNALKISPCILRITVPAADAPAFCKRSWDEQLTLRTAGVYACLWYERSSGSENALEVHSGSDREGYPSRMYARFGLSGLCLVSLLQFTFKGWFHFVIFGITRENKETKSVFLA